MKKIIFIILILSLFSCSQENKEMELNKNNNNQIQKKEDDTEKIAQIRELLKDEIENKEIKEEIKFEIVKEENVDRDTNIESLEENEITSIKKTSDEEIDDLINIIFKNTD